MYSTMLVYEARSIFPPEDHLKDDTSLRQSQTASSLRDRWEYEPDIRGLQERNDIPFCACCGRQLHLHHKMDFHADTP